MIEFAILASITTIPVWLAAKLLDATNDSIQAAALVAILGSIAAAATSVLLESSDYGLVAAFVVYVLVSMSIFRVSFMKAVLISLFAGGFQTVMLMAFGSLDFKG